MTLQMIKRGIQEDNMRMVLEGYNNMTGEGLELPRHLHNKDEGVTHTGKDKKIIKRQVKASGKNLFVDEEGEKRVLKRPVEKSKKSTPARPSNVVEIKCSGKCKKKYRIDKSYLDNDGNYICSDCIISRHGR